MIAKLVNIAPITMAYDTFISFYKCIFHGVSKPTHTSMATNSKLKSGMQNARYVHFTLSWNSEKRLLSWQFFGCLAYKVCNQCEVGL